MTGLLEGIKVIDMGHLAAIPAAAVTLTDWGADVIKVEPLSGEMARGTTRTVGVAGVDWGVQLMNRNKKGRALELINESASASCTNSLKDQMYSCLTMKEARSGSCGRKENAY